MWPTERARAKAVTPPLALSAREPAKTAAGTRAVGSPRVLSDLFRMGR